MRLGFRNGKRCVGENHPSSKLTDAQAVECYTRYVIEGERAKDVAASLGIGVTQVYRIASGENRAQATEGLRLRNGTTAR